MVRNKEICSVNQSIIQSIGQSVNQSVNRSINLSINQSIGQSLNQTLCQSVPNSPPPRPSYLCAEITDDVGMIVHGGKNANLLYACGGVGWMRGWVEGVARMRISYMHVGGRVG